MKALITLTPAESQKLIARAVLSLPEFQKARQDGMIALHPAAAPTFIFEALTGRKPEGIWTRGSSSRGDCAYRRRSLGIAPPGSRDP